MLSKPNRLLLSNCIRLASGLWGLFLYGYSSSIFVFMEMDKEICRSNLLMSRQDTAVVVVDVQEKLVPVMLDSSKLRWNIRRLMDGAKILGVPILATEQYPEKLGPTVSELAVELSDVPEKLSFSCCGSEDFVRQLRNAEIYKVLVCGIEAHVCVMQTVFDLLTAGYEVYVPTDAVSSRFEIDRDTAIRRMEASGVTLTTTEAALFEWCEVAGTPEFKQISALVREVAPQG